jgi:hypothetical protein
METNTNTNNEECLELKNIKYKTMLLKGTPIKETKSSNNLLNLENFLENEKNNNKNEPWCKLNKTIKIQKLLEFVEAYKKEHSLNEEEENLLVTFFKDCLERKKLQRVKDVIYDKDTGTIKNIPALHYTKSTKHFTLKNIEKRVSTLKSLAPKKINSTIKNKSVLRNDENGESDNEVENENEILDNDN